MPTYDYECPRGHIREHFSKTMSSAPRTRHCAVCNRTARRLIGKGVPPIFKGDGFQPYRGT